jgi:hypothetical protein
MADTATTTTTTTTTGAAAAKKHAVNLQEVQETVSRLASHKGVMAVLILNSRGDIVTQSGGGDGAIGNPKLLSKMLHAANTYVCSMPSSSSSSSSSSHVGGDHRQTGDGTAGGGDVVQDGGPAIPDGKSSTAEENISFVRIRTPRDEILVAPKLGYTLVVLQDPTVSSL